MYLSEGNGEGDNADKEGSDALQQNLFVVQNTQSWQLREGFNQKQ